MGKKLGVEGSISWQVDRQTAIDILRVVEQSQQRLHDARRRLNAAELELEDASKGLKMAKEMLVDFINPGKEA